MIEPPSKRILVEEPLPRKHSPSRTNGYRWDAIGNYIISTIKLPESFAVDGARYETLVGSTVDGKWEWDADGSGKQSETEAEADAAHEAACDRIRRRIQ